MKKRLFTLIAVSAMALLWHSCTHEEQKGKLRFGMQLTDNTDLKSATADRKVTEALITIVGQDGEIIYDKEPLQLLEFGEQYITRLLELPVGEFKLTEFMLIDSSGTVLWATPVEGSNLAPLVNDPLPVWFGIAPDETTNLSMEVIRVKDYNPGDFGYASFSINFVDRICLKVFYSSRCMEEWNDSILGSDGSGAPILQPRFIISVNDRLILDEPLNQGLNYYRIPLVSEWYLLSARNCHGDLFYREKVPFKMLLEHRCQPEFPPLEIFDGSNPGIIITPEGLKEPDIKQGVFGMISLPVDTATKLDINQVWPVVRDLYIFPFFGVMDSIYTFAPIGCYIPPDLIPLDPVAIVRSNSEGFFQAPLEVGEYLYLVKEGEGFYLDAYISSRRPGYFMVFPEEVTKLRISIIDCSMWL